jgi:hypothetical protein
VPSKIIYGGNVKNVGKCKSFGALAILSLGLLAGGCKSAPPLSKDDATSMIKANYTQAAAVPITIAINDSGMQQGVTAKYWTGLKRYPNGYWADFKLTDDGKKVLKTSDGKDVIEWRPENPGDSKYSIAMTTIVTSQPKVSHVGDPVDVDATSKTVTFSEDANLDALPGPLKQIAQSSTTGLSTSRRASFVLANGAWKLDSVQ